MGAATRGQGNGAAALEESVREAIALLPTPIQVYSCDGRVVLENAAFQERFGSVDSDELATLVASTVAGRASAFQAALGGHTRAVPLGTERGVRVIALYAPLRSGNDERIAHVCVSYVTAEAVPAVELPPALKRSPAEDVFLAPTARSPVAEEHLRFIVDNVPQLIWSTLPDGYVDFYNRRWYEYIGRTVEQTRGAGWNDFLHPDDQQRSWARWQRSLTCGEPYEIEYRFRRHDGEYRWFLGRALPMRDAAGRIVRWFGSSTDIDDQKRGERLRDAALAELEKATRLKDEFLATASHELRTPLNAIFGWARMQRLHPELSPRAMEVIERNSKALADLINDLLDMSRIVANKLSVEPEAVALAPLVHSAVDIVRPAAEAKELSLRLAVYENVGAIVGDPGRLQQVLSNLLSNAVKFTPRGGTITVGCERRGTQVVIEVSDNGRGIAPEFLPHVFDRFRQADGSHTRREGGLGLGLSIAKHLIELHGGQLMAFSEGLGRGAKFTVLLPSAPVQPPTLGLGSRRQASATIRLDGIRALIVDDDADARELLATLLDDAGAVVEAADSVDAALASLQRQAPDVVLSDIGMPDRSGYDLIKELRARGFRRSVVALTAFARAEDRSHALRAGFDAHLTKPVEPAELLSTLARLVERPSE